MSDRWRQVAELFDRALPLDAAARRHLLARCRVRDRSISREVEALLRADAAALDDDRFLTTPIRATIRSLIHSLRTTRTHPE